MTYAIIITFLALISIIINIILIFYIKYILEKMLFLTEDIKEFMISIKDFSNHINGIYELEMFYGDETLKSLMDHLKLVIEKVKNFKELYIFDDEEEEELKIFNDEEKEGEIEKETLFYKGS